jgi:hypothetical protein
MNRRDSVAPTNHLCFDEQVAVITGLPAAVGQALRAAARIVQAADERRQQRLASIV